MGAKEEAEKFFRRHDIWDNLVTQQTIAIRSGVTIQAVQGWRDKFPDFPKVMKPIRDGGNYAALYWWPDVQEFKKKHGLGKK